MDTVRGVFYPEGGMHAVPRGMAQALDDAGVPIHLGVEVREVLRRSDGAVAGILTSDGDRVAADAVVCTVDLPVAYDRLLPGVSAPRTVRTGAPPAPSCSTTSATTLALAVAVVASTGRPAGRSASRSRIRR